MTCCLKMLSANCLLANREWEYSASATSTGLVNARPPSLAGRAKRVRSSSDWSMRPVMLGMRVCLIFSSIGEGPSNCEMLGVVLMRKDHLREEPRVKAQ